MKSSPIKSTAASDDSKIANYIESAPEPARPMLEEIRKIVRAAAPAEATEVFSYGMPGFRYKRALLWYGAFKAHVGFFPGSPPMIKSLANELKDFKTSKGSIQFPFGKPVPVALVRKIVKLRIAENEARHK